MSRPAVPAPDGFRVRAIGSSGAVQKFADELARFCAAQGHEMTRSITRPWGQGMRYDAEVLCGAEDAAVARGAGGGADG